MDFRKAVDGDLDAIQAIIDGAKEYLRGMGIDQWQGGYPDREVMRADIADGTAYVLVGDDGVVAATATLTQGDDPVYRNLKGGVWETGDNCCIIHRMAMSDACRGKGLSARMFAELEKRSRELGADAVKADTHPDNRQMQHLMTKNGFTYRGTVFFQGGDKLAYEKMLG